MSNAEDEITAWFERQSNLSAEDFPIGIGDDMAQIRVSDNASILVTTDMLLEGVHFDLAETSLEQVGYKAMAVSLSDCAAMATIPVAAVVGVALAKGFGREQLEQLHRGITSAGDRFGCALVGGDITSWKGASPLAISVAMLSRPGANGPITRSGAEVGDRVCVTGTLGGSRFGKHLEFVPRVKEAMKIASIVNINAMIDISDGLSSDMNRICTRSGVGAIIEAEKIPVSSPAKSCDDPLGAALNDGEDFELLFTLYAKDCERLLAEWDGPTAITQIGTVTDTGKMQISRRDGTIGDLQAGGYDHLVD